MMSSSSKLERQYSLSLDLSLNPPGFFKSPPPSKQIRGGIDSQVLDQLLNGSVIGVDEAGRGPLAGSVYASAVLWHVDTAILGVADSKQLRPATRDLLAQEIRQKVAAYSIASASVEEIDTYNILHATMLAMLRAVSQLNAAHGTPILIDGNRIFLHPEMECYAVIKGDQRVPAISAASILAKTARDAEMEQLDTVYPAYGFKRHKGYGTAEHLLAIQQHGVITEHRRTFGIVKSLTAQAQGEL